MPPKPRPYRPKARGCFECSKRRISCDRTEPECEKYLSRGLKCSGLGIRHRFSDGVASRGFWVGKTIQEVFETVSDHIAGEMVAIDGLHNGWRHLVLPVAHLDQLVLNSVLTVASFHRYGRHLSQPTNLDFHEDSLPAPPGLSCQLFTTANPTASQLYARTIADLQRRDLGQSDPFSRLSILLTILVLLVAVMVTGSDDFPLLFRLLESALEAIGGEHSLGEDELSRFIVRQVHKMRVYAAPLINEQWGITTLSTRQNITQAFECIRHCSRHQPDHYPITALVMSLIQQSYDIYLDQARRDILSVASVSDSFPRLAESICRVQRFKETFKSFPTGSPGKQVLIWATFVAASDSVLEEHKSFFRQVFASFYERSGFENLRKGMDQLERVWKRSALGDRWISLLPQARVFVM
ncbi:hypothetical protein CKAH01_09047 [Colletotrichum kahawae]|uniref:Zn(2)-C6 fungal-type domain-containing protein n=1 Tax=Colletotrichum kahawae TaxID=34407 RepID=A0AAE0CZK9_COLKA|nr:hypothetical protein CKAH01_09047 [Colletotrichum kahawae]